METADSPFAELDKVEGPLTHVEILKEVFRWKDTPPEKLTIDIEADVIGLRLGVNDEGGSSWGTRYGPSATFRQGNADVEVPSRDQVTPEIVEAWERRARAARHPLLRHRYADLVWDLSQRFRKVRPGIELARISIDAVLDGLRTGVLGREVEAYRYATRALDLATSITDPQRAEAVERALLEYERSHARDRLAGTWGKSFDVILDGRSKLLEQEQAAVVDDMERRLERLAAQSPPALDPHAVEAAALRLARYYQKARRAEDVARVVRVYAAAFKSASANAQAMVGVAWLEKVHAVLEQYGLKADADALVPELRELGKRSIGELKTFEATTTIRKEEMEAFVDSLLAGDPTTALMRITARFVPDRDQAEKQVREFANDAPLSSFIPKKIVDDDGRTISVIGALDDDLDGNVIQHISQTLGFNAIFLRVGLAEAAKRLPLTVESLMERIRKSPVFEPEALPLVEEGLRHYFEGRYAAALHLLIPQVEAAVRRLAALAGANVYKRNRNSGLLDVRLLHDLLLDEHVVAALTPNVALYLRILLVDQRGWNLRNDVCHGQFKASNCTSTAADRILHALMLFLWFEAKEGSTAR
jgi:hypothetical protein